MAGGVRPENRPLSPHLQVWRWHVTMLTSILHRLSGVGLYGAAIGIAFWLIAAAAGPEAYEVFASALNSWPGQAVIYVSVAGVAYHLANGIRHLVFDAGAGLSPSDADTSAWFAILFGLAAPIGLWALVSFGA